MKCANCGAALEEGTKFCYKCGTEVKEQGNDTQKNAAEIIKKYEISSASSSQTRNKIIQLVVGTIIIIIGFTRIGADVPSISSTSFGGDFYTYTYRGIVAISQILQTIHVSLGWIIVAIGAVIDMNALRK